MSILLSTYWSDGIVLCADRNATVVYETEGDLAQYVEVGRTTKVLAWPRKAALVGYVGLGQLAGLEIDEWMRQFVAGTRDFESIDALAQDLRQLLQQDFDGDYPSGVDVGHAGAIVQLAGFKRHEGVMVPVSYVITNIPALEPRVLFSRGVYPPAERHFAVSDHIPQVMQAWGAAYPQGVRDKIVEIEQTGDFLWFNVGYMYPAFSAFKGALWDALKVLREQSLLPAGSPMSDQVAFSKMAVRIFGVFFEHYFLPQGRAVGGGVDTEWMPWPE